MPTYSYLCECGNEYEMLHSIHEDPEVECGQCGGTMRRKPSAAATQFSGSGFYSTDKNK